MGYPKIKNFPAKDYVEKREYTAYTPEIQALTEKPKELIRAEQDAEMLRLRCRGLSYNQIAKQLGIASDTLQLRMRAVLEDVVAEPREAAIQLELTRLDMLLVRLDEWMDDNPAYVTQYLQVCDRRARLLGLDQPRTISVQANLPELPSNRTELELVEAELLRLP